MSPDQFHDNERPGPIEDTRARKYTLLQQWSYSRLSRLLNLRTQQLCLQPPDDHKLKQIDRALFSTYQDCKDQRLVVEIRELVHKHLASNG